MSIEAMKLALEAISVLKPYNWEDKELQGRAWDALKAALKKAEPNAITDQNGIPMTYWGGFPIKIDPNMPKDQIKIVCKSK